MNLTRNQQIVLGGGVALIVSSFLPWYGVFGFSINAWDAEFWAWGGVLVGTAAAGLVALSALGGVRFSVGRWGVGQLATALAGVGLVLILIRLLTESSAVKPGLFLGLAAAAAIAYGTFMSVRATGGDLNPFTATPAPHLPGRDPIASPPGPPMAAIPPPQAVAFSPPQPLASPVPTPPVAPPKPAMPPPQPAFVGYWFYVMEPAVLTSSGGYTVAQLNPGAWYWASAERDGWVETRTDEGAAGWVAAAAVHRQS